MAIDSAAITRIKAIVGPGGFVEKTDELAPFLQEWRGRFKGQTPLCIRPASAAEVAAVVTVCSETGTAIVPQGGNTGLVGGQLPGLEGEQLLLNLGRMNRIRRVDAVDNSITVDAGCTLASVQDAATEVNRLFPLSLASEGTCQIGGNLSSNAGGIHVLRYGNARDLVLGLEVVTADGQLWNGLRTLRKDNTGYDLKHLFIGAEGTLGIITGAALKLFPRHRKVTTVLMAVATPDAAVSLLSQLREATDDAVLAFELISRFGLELVLRHIPGCVDPMTAPAPWYVLCDLLVESAPAHSAVATAADSGLVSDAVFATTGAQTAALWRLRESISEAQKPEGGSIKHDVSVPVSRIPAFLKEALAAVQRLIPGIRPVPFGHVGDGNLHFNLTQPVGQARADFLAKWEAVNEVVHDIVARHEGSISAEHGIGFAKRDEIRRYKSPLEIEIMRTIKRALDPRGILNPGKGTAYS
jgi:FAD/FMN-containing dehydrogenase